MYQNRKNVTKTTPNRATCAGRMPQTRVLFVAVVSVGTVVKFILADGSTMHQARTSSLDAHDPKKEVLE